MVIIINPQPPCPPPPNPHAYDPEAGDPVIPNPQPPCPPPNPDAGDPVIPCPDPCPPPVNPNVIVTPRPWPPLPPIKINAEDITTATNIINGETDILNAKIQGAMDMARATNSGRKRTPSGAVYAVAAKSKAIISTSISEFNTNVEVAKSVLQRGLEA
jgi:hypothetical protein